MKKVKHLLSCDDVGVLVNASFASCNKITLLIYADIVRRRILRKFDVSINKPVPDVDILFTSVIA